MKKTSLSEGQLKNLPYLNKATLAEILEKKGENLNYWVKKLLAQGDLIALKKGLYVPKLYLLSLERTPALREAYLEYLANILRYPSYLSLEYCLAKYGLIPEGVYSLTSVAIKSSRTFKNDLGNFIYRKIKNELFFGFVENHFEDKRVKIATKAKAFFDFLYFKKFPNQRILKQELVEDLRINWDVFSGSDKEEFEAIVLKSGSSKMGAILRILKEKKLL